MFNRRSVRTRHMRDAPAPLLSVLFCFGAASFPHTLQLAFVARGFVDDIMHTTMASNCPALHIPRNRADPTCGARSFPRSSHAFNYRKGKGLGTRLHPLESCSLSNFRWRTGGIPCPQTTALKKVGSIHLHTV